LEVGFEGEQFLDIVVLQLRQVEQFAEGRFSCKVDTFAHMVYDDAFDSGYEPADAIEIHD
jgi:hypothetical protein